MAACTTTYFEVGRGWSVRVAERNAELLAQQALRRRGARTPEFHFSKSIDNSRLVKAADPVRVREMRVFSLAAAVLFLLVMVYGLQHFYAIEGGYRVESEKQMRDQLREENRGTTVAARARRSDGTPARTCGAAAGPGDSSRRCPRCQYFHVGPGNPSGAEGQLLASSS